ncbi:MAG TPA: Na+/H+ antiporter NhaC family protein [Acidobacteriota bacterium]|nr:Na+/H+ antiporter NhaC family protein [Acidobacteriota bacterium]
MRLSSKLPKDPLQRLLILLVAALPFLLLAWGSPEGLDENDSYGLYSLLPAFSAILLAFLTREVLFALMMGIAVGGIVVSDPNLLQRFMIPAIGSEQYALILLVYLWCLGGLLGLWTRTGGARAFAEWAAGRMVRGPRSARLFAWLIGIVFHQGGTISTVLAGTTVRPVTDRENISHEELSYIIDSTASPVATLIPLNVWPIYVGGFAAGLIPLLPDEGAAVSFFYRAIPLNFYGIFAVLMTLLLALDLLPFMSTKMRKAIERSRAGKGLNAPGAAPLASEELSREKVPDHYRPAIIDFAVPILVLIGWALGSYLQTGSVQIAEAFGLSVVAASLLGWLRGLSIADVLAGIVDGCKGVTTGAILLGLAVTLGAVSKELGTARYIVATTSDWIVPVLLPAILMGICMVVAFSIGSSFGTFAVIVPLSVPLAYTVSPEPLFNVLCYASVVGGSIFGDQCSPISDTTILSSLACGADLMDHVTTQLPLAMAAAGLAAVCSTLVAIAVL